MKVIRLNENDIINVIKNVINEFDTSTYLNLMRKTKDFDKDKFDSNGEYMRNRYHKANKKRNINILASESFERDFYNEFPKGQIKILTNNGEYIFKELIMNREGYSVLFTNNKPSSQYTNITIHKDNNSEDQILIDSYKDRITVTNPKSIYRLNNMLKYN